MSTTLESSAMYDFTPGQSDKVDALIESATKLGREARQAALKHVFQPTLEATREVREAIQNRARDTSERLESSLRRLQEKAQDHPRATLGYVLAAGVLLGLLLPRR